MKDSERQDAPELKFDLFQASVFQVGLDTGLIQLTSNALNISKEIT